MEWISIKDKLPGYGVEVIGSFNNQLVGKFVDFFEYQQGSECNYFEFVNDRNEECEPTHWMIKPKPFNEE